MHHMLNPDGGEPNLLSVLRDNDYFVWWGGKNDLVPGQLGYEKHCDVHFRPNRSDYERWGYEPREGSHGGDLAWRGKQGSDTFYSFFKGKLELETVEEGKEADIIRSLMQRAIQNIFA